MLSKEIAYTYSWQKSLAIALFGGLLTASLLILLQPFDTNQHIHPQKSLLLSGYGFCLIIGYLSLHFIENKIYSKRNKSWTLSAEIALMSFFMLSIIISTYLYNTLVINRIAVSFENFIHFALHFAVPFFPFLLPLFIFLRQYYGKIDVVQQNKEQSYLISGNNKNEAFSIVSSQFLYAQAQQNYVELFLLKDQEITKQLLRTTLSTLQEQLPFTIHTHRSYIINPMYLLKISGNTRKRILHLNYIDTPLPLSPKYYENVKSDLTNSSLKVQ